MDDFVAEHSSQWAVKTVSQNRAYLKILVEYFGPDRMLGTITRQDANAVKKILQVLPTSRNTKLKSKATPLVQVINKPGHKKLAPKTINSHIQTFMMFHNYSERHSYAPHSLFDKMKGAKAKNSETEHKPFTFAQVSLIYTELTENPSELMRKGSLKRECFLTCSPGRVNEICQLNITDVQQHGDTWFLNITAEGNDKKRIKSEVGRHKVPRHSELIHLGFLNFVDGRKNCTRLFPDYSYSVTGGYGRNFGPLVQCEFFTQAGHQATGPRLR